MGFLFQTLAALIACALVVPTESLFNLNECGKPVDVAFLVDSSGSLGRRNYKRLLDAVNEFATYFDVSPMSSHAAVIVFSDAVENPITFNDYLTLEEFKAKVSGLRFMSQRTRIDLALDMAAKKVFTVEGNTRHFVTKIAILMTDGVQTRTRSQIPLTKVSAELRKQDVLLYVIGIGRGVNRDQLDSLVEKRNHVLEVRDFRTFEATVKIIADRVCKVVPAFNIVPCQHPVELGFVLHCSESLSETNFNKLKQLIIGIAKVYGVDGGKSRAGLVVYNDIASLRLRFEQAKNLTQFTKVLADLRHEPGKNRIDLALKLANQGLFAASSRNMVSRVVILVTVGKQTRSITSLISPKGVGAQLRARGIKILIVAVGSDVDVSALEKIVEDPTHVIHVQQFDQLNNEVKPLAKRVCDESVPTAKRLEVTAKSESIISARWELPWDPKGVITGYELTWKMIENSRGDNIINAPLQSSGILPARKRSYKMRGLVSHSLYKIDLIPHWRGVRGDTLATRARTLADTDECLTTPCDVNAECTNTPHLFECKCNTGYSGNGFTCNDINECISANPCDANANCENTPGSFKCQCKTGYSGDGFTCIDDQECLKQPCDVNANCTNTPGSFICLCNIGYSGDGLSCTDIDECLKSPCHVNAKCANTAGSFTCQCKIGFSGDGFTCTDNDECGETPCDSNARCTNSLGSFTCQCNTGYSGDGFTCIDNNECDETPCDANARCTNTKGSFECKCNSGYSGDGFFCKDDDECVNGPCDLSATCTNTPGSFTCRCFSGYSGDGFACVDNNECSETPCDINGKCVNSPGSFKCECRVGYAGDGFTCADINECEFVKSPCDVNAICFNTFGTYYCECKSGYNGNGRVCSVVNICSYPMDLAIAMDTSDSISKASFETQKAAVIMLARSFDLSKLGTHTSVIVYGSDAKVEIKLGQHLTIEEFSAAVRNLSYRGGNTRIDKALGLAYSVVFTPENGGRSGMPKMLIIMTDGQQTSAPDAISLEEAVAPLRLNGVKVVTIGIGKEVDDYELLAMSESRDNIFHVQSFDTLFETVTSVGQSLCQKAKKDCKNHADIAILMDSSASMRGGNYVKQKSLVKAIAREFEVSIHGSHVGLVLYNTDAEVITTLNNKTKLEDFEIMIDSLPLKGGKIRLDKALRLVSSDVFTRESGMRDENVPKIMFIMTDGTQNKKCDEEALELTIAPLRNEGVHVVAIGVGEAEENELRPLVKSPGDLFAGADFDEVTESVLKFIKELCKDADRSCAVGSQFVDIDIDGCVNEKPVEVAVCDGKCPSGTRYISEAPYYEGRCTCCYPMIVSSKDVHLACLDGSSKLHRITEVSACECRSCGNSAAAPPVENS